MYVLNAVDGCIPSDLATGTPAEIEEERRLLYVAMTRAKDELHVVVPQRFYVHQQAAGGDWHMYGSRTRFIPREIDALFEARVWPQLRVQDAGSIEKSPAPAVDVAARMRDMWR